LVFQTEDLCSQCGDHQLAMTSNVQVDKAVNIALAMIPQGDKIGLMKIYCIIPFLTHHSINSSIRQHNLAHN